MIAPPNDSSSSRRRGFNRNTQHQTVAGGTPQRWTQRQLNDSSRSSPPAAASPAAASPAAGGAAATTDDQPPERPSEGLAPAAAPAGPAAGPAPDPVGDAPIDPAIDAAVGPSAAAPAASVGSSPRSESDRPATFANTSRKRLALDGCCGGRDGDGGDDDDHDDTAVVEVTTAFADMELPRRRPPPPQQARVKSPFRVKPIDLRLQMQASKLTFIVIKRKKELIRAGFKLRPEAGASTIQEFLDGTREARLSSDDLGGGDGDGDGGSRCFVPSLGVVPTIFGCRNGGSVNIGVRTEGRGERGGSSGQDDGGGGGADHDGDAVGGEGADRSSDVLETWRDMTFVYCEALGWVFLHHATKEGIQFVRELVGTVHCHDMGFLAPDSKADSALQALVSLLDTCTDVIVIVDGAVAKVAGTERQVENVSRAIEAIASSSTQMHANALWYWRGASNEPAGTWEWHPMSATINAALETAFTQYKGYGGSNSSMYFVGTVLYKADFTLMEQRNTSTGFVRPIARMVPDKETQPLPRCPKENMPLTGFREGTTYSLVAVSKEEEAMVKSTVFLTLPLAAVVGVQHVWNSFLWGHYAQNAKSIGNERLMFHGAPSGTLSQICKTGFDKRLAGSANGACYGQGCYFARDAIRSAAYMGDATCGQMLMAKVLVGEHTPGTADMVKPPRMGGACGDREYDSTSSGSVSPKIIVTYKDWQAYPMYLITFGPRSVYFS